MSQIGEPIKSDLLEFAGFFQFLGRKELTVAGDTITVNNLPKKKWLMILIYIINSGIIIGRLRFNNDAGTTYADRRSLNGTADIINESQTSILVGDADSQPQFEITFVINIATKEKLVINHSVNQRGAGAATAPERYEMVGKWANTVDQITRVDIINNQTGDFAIGSYIEVYGAD